jgi:hypothetical protein
LEKPTACPLPREKRAKKGPFWGVSKPKKTLFFQKWRFLGFPYQTLVKIHFLEKKDVGAL